MVENFRQLDESHFCIRPCQINNPPAEGLAERVSREVPSFDLVAHLDELKMAVYHLVRDDAAEPVEEARLQHGPSTPQPPKEFPRILSSTEGLADFLGCGRTMAFSIIKSGVLKADAIQYKVGQCWKFNREKLEKHLADNPELLGRIRCKRPENG